MVDSQFHYHQTWPSGQRHLTEKQDLQLGVQSYAKPAIFQPRIAKKSTRGTLNQANGNLQ